MTLRAIRVVSVPVSDQDRARDFYVEKLGFTVQSDISMADMRWLQLTPPGGEPSITLVTWFPTMPAGSAKGLVIECDDVGKTMAELRERGVNLNEDKPEEAPWGRYVTLDDPDGNGWVVQEWPS